MDAFLTRKPEFGFMFHAFQWTEKARFSWLFLLVQSWSRPYGMLVFRHSNQQVSTLRTTIISLVLMHSGIVNGHQLLCDAHTVLLQHRETAGFLCITIILFYFFVCLSLWQFLFYDASIVCFSNLTRAAELVFWFPSGPLSVNTIGTKMTFKLWLCR